MDKKILVTGGAGFIGSNLAIALTKNNNDVTVLDNLSSGNIQNIPTNLLKEEKIKFIEGDIRDIELVNNLVKKTDIVFHLAEYIPPTKKFGAGHVVKYSIENPLMDFDVSAKGSLIVLNCVKDHNKRILFTSTAAVYGTYQSKISEEFEKMPVSPYGASKLCAEEYIRLYNRIYDTRSTICRLFNVYGPNQTKYVMYDILTKLSKNPKKIELFGTGKEKRDFIFVGDVVNAFIALVDNPESVGEIYNIGTGIPTSIKTVLDIIIDKLGIDPEIEFLGSSWKGDISFLVSENKKLLKTGINPSTSISEGLGHLMNWFRTTQSLKGDL